MKKNRLNTHLTHRGLHPWGRFGKSLFGGCAFVGLGVVLATMFVPGTLPPAGMETSQYFWFLWAITLWTAVNAVWIAAVGAFGKKLRPIPWNWGDVVAGLLLGYLLVHGVVKGGSSKLDVWELALLGALYLNLRVAIGQFGGRQVNRAIAFLILVEGVVQLYVGFGQLYGHTVSNHAAFRITGTFHNPAPLGGYLAIVCGVALCQIRTLYASVARCFRLLGARSLLIGRIWSFGFACLCLGGSLMLLPATQSRIAWVGALAAGTGALLSNGTGRKIGRWIRQHRTAALIGLLCGLLVGGICIRGAYRMKAASADGRILIWKTTLKMIADHPWTGVGAGCYAGVYGDYQAVYFASGAATEAEKHVAGSGGAAFNDYLQCTAGTGWIGLALFCSLIASAFVGYTRRKTTDCRPLVCGLVALLVFALASYPMQLLSFRIVWVVLITAGVSQLSRKPARPK